MPGLFFTYVTLKLNKKYQKGNNKNKKRKGACTMKILEKLYKEWREFIEEHNAQELESNASLPVYGSYDCGKASVREDFNNYVKNELGLKNEITFEKMLQLEKNYEKRKNLC